MKTRDKEFVAAMLASFGVEKVGQINRGCVNREHIRMTFGFLGDNAIRLIAALSIEADLDLEPVYMGADHASFKESGLSDISRCARVVICRISGATGREIDFTSDGIVVSHQRSLQKKKCKAKQKLQPA